MGGEEFKLQTSDIKTIFGIQDGYESIDATNHEKDNTSFAKCKF